MISVETDDFCRTPYRSARHDNACRGGCFGPLLIDGDEGLMEDFGKKQLFLCHSRKIGVAGKNGSHPETRQDFFEPQFRTEGKLWKRHIDVRCVQSGEKLLQLLRCKRLLKSGKFRSAWRFHLIGRLSRKKEHHR